MKVVISNEITITEPAQEILDWCRKELVISNPDYEKKERLGLWLGNTPKTLSLYKRNGNSLILPVGALEYIRHILTRLDVEYEQKTANNGFVDYNSEVNLYEY